MSADLYADLGVPRAASQAEIKRAYRRRARETHPDRAGGDTAACARVNRAYMVLSDAERKAQYDATGNENAVPPADTALAEVSKMVIEAVGAANDPDSQDPLRAVREVLLKQVQANDHRMRGMRVDAKKYERAAARVKRKSGTENFLSRALEDQARKTLEAVEGGERAQTHCARLLALLDEYGYELDAPTILLVPARHIGSAYTMGALP